MNNFFLFLFVVFFSLKINGQIIEASPKIPTNDYLDLLATNLEIHEEIIKKHQNSSIDITFIITIAKDGSIINPRIKNDSLNLEPALKKALENLPKWNPKTENGVAVVSRKAINLIIPVEQTFNENPIAEQVYMKASPKDGLQGLYKNYAKSFNSTKLTHIKEINMRATFTVEEDGSLTNIKIVESNVPSLNRKAIRLIESLPKWNPAIENGNPVRSSFSLPLKIKINN